MDSAELEAAGLYDPKAPNAAERLELLEWLAARGATVARMVQAAREGSLTGLAGDLVLRPGGRYTLAETAERAGLPAERVRELSLAVGLPATADEAVYTDDDVDTFRSFTSSMSLFGAVPVLRFVRTIGWSLARIAEAAVSVFIVNVEGPMRQRGKSERALAEANLRAIEALAAVQALIHSLFLTHMEAAIRRFRRARLAATVDTVHMTVGFVDLVGFTTLSRRMPARELAGLVERFEETAHDVVTTRGGRVVKLIGDEVMFVALDAAAACDAALALFEHFAGDPSVTPRGALASGELVVRGGDYYGPIVNLAARVAQIAVPNEMLVTAEVAAETASPTLRFEPAGKRMLKGFDEPIALLAVERA
jgi:class 3 adenylate cyclase